MDRAPRFFVEEGLEAGQRISLQADRARQAVSVLRLRPGDRVVLFNGAGEDYPATIVAASRTSLSVELGHPRPALMPPPPRIILGLALIKSDRFDWAVQKATELGVSAIAPLETDRTVVTLRADRDSHRLQRWRRIAVEAAEQCGRGDVPLVSPPHPLLDVARGAAGTLLLLSEDDPRVELAELLPHDPSPVTLLIGPEGGFTAGEREALAAMGARAASLGPLILRSETAAIAAVAFVRALASAGHVRDTERA